jgi:hypothetical protein
MNQSILKKLMKRTRLSHEQIVDIIVAHHYLKQLVPKRKSKSVSVTVDLKVGKHVKLVAKLLKVSVSAVVYAAVARHIKSGLADEV